MNWIIRQFERIPQPWRIIVVGVLVLVIVLVIWFYAARAVNGLSNWFYDRGTRSSHEEIDRLTTEAIKAKSVAAEALRALEAEKKITEQERMKRELAEGLLADKTKTANEKLRIYEETIKQSPTVSAPTTDIDALCQRAAAAGVPCQ